MCETLNRNILILLATTVCQHTYGNCSAAVLSTTATASPNSTTSGFSETIGRFSGFSSVPSKGTHNFVTTTKKTAVDLQDRRNNSQTNSIRNKTIFQSTQQQNTRWMSLLSTTISSSLATSGNSENHTTALTYDDRTRVISTASTADQQTNSTSGSLLQTKNTTGAVTETNLIAHRVTIHKVVSSPCDNCLNISKTNISTLSSLLLSPPLFTDSSKSLHPNTERNNFSTTSVHETFRTESDFNYERNISQSHFSTNIAVVSTPIRLSGTYSNVNNTRHTEITIINSTLVVLSTQITTSNKLPQSANLVSPMSSATTISNAINSSLYSEMQNLTELAETRSVSWNSLDMEESTTISSSSAYLISTSSYGMAATTSDFILPTKQSSINETDTSQVSTYLYFKSSSDRRSEILKASPVSEYYSSTAHQGYDSAKLETSTDFLTEQVTSSSFYSSSSTFHGEFQTSAAVSSSSYADVLTSSSVMPPTTPDGTYYVELDNLKNRVSDLKSTSDGYRIATFALTGTLLIVLIILIVLLCRRKRKHRSKSKNRFTGIDDDIRKPVIHRPKPTFAYGRDSAQESLRFSGRISTATLDEGDEMAALGTFTSKPSSYNNNMHSESLDT